MSGNQALNINYYVAPDADLAITSHGSDWYWAVCAIFVVSTLAFIGMSLTKPMTHRIFYYIAAGITLVSAISYFSMGAGLGQVPIQVEFIRSNSKEVFAAGTREVFYVRYINWAVTTPLILLGVLLTAGLPPTSLILTIVAGEVSVVTALVGALTDTSYKWGYAIFGFSSFIYVIFSILGDGRREASALGSNVSRTFVTTGGLTVFTGLILYPIAWGLSEGGNVIHPDSEAIFYGILDLLSRGVFGFLLAFGHRNIDPADIGLRFRDLSANPTHEKTTGHSNGHNGVNNGVNNTV